MPPRNGCFWEDSSAASSVRRWREADILPSFGRCSLRRQAATASLQSCYTYEEISHAIDFKPHNQRGYAIALVQNSLTGPSRAR